MDIWGALAGIGTVVAAGVAVWAVIVAHHANRLAKQSVPQKLPIIEQQYLGNDRWRFTNVGTAALYDAVLVEMLDDRENGNSGSPKTMEPGDQLEIVTYVVPQARRVFIRGHEMRDGVRVARWFQVL